MIEAPAEVVRVEQGRVWVRLSEREGGCGRCNEPGGCRSMRITDAFGKPTDVFALASPLAVQAGDRVKIGIPEGGPLRAALLSYGLGAVLVLACAAAGKLLVGGAAPDVGAGIGMLAGLILALAVNRVLARSRNWRKGLGMILLPDASECRHRHST